MHRAGSELHRRQVLSGLTGHHARVSEQSGLRTRGDNGMRSLIRLKIFLLIAAVALAQTATSRITGTVSDASGALVPGAMVTARHEATGVTYTQTTTEAGLYGFPSLPVGSYAITVALPGFKTASKTGNILEVDTPLVINMSLEVGGITETVSIAAEAEVLDRKSVV